jgi:two-component system response regulator HydG
VSANVLVIDDESSILESLRILLRNEGFTPHVAQGGRQGLEQIASLSPDIVLTDVRMPNVDGIEVLSAVRRQDPGIPVILMTAQATLQSAVQAVNEGAFYYIQKPFRNDDLVAILRRAAEHRRLRVENQSLKQDIRRRETSLAGRPVGKSRSWMEVLRLAETVAPTESTVLIQGESGTGKEVVARYIHQLSGRADGSFQSINCGALPESLLESELFGHVKGSFTGAVKDKQGLFTAAAGGTFFLDEIGETTPATQVKLLRVLQHREVIPVGATEPIAIDTRLIAATNRDLERRCGAPPSGRICIIGSTSSRCTSLRCASGGRHTTAGRVVLQRLAATRGGERDALRCATEAIQAYQWPGNVRELENALERAWIMTPGSRIEVNALPERVTSPTPSRLLDERVAPNPTLEAIERAYILWVLNAEGGNKTRAAESLGIDPSTLHRKLSRFGTEG